MTSRTTPIRSVRICSFCASERVSQNRRGSMDMLRIHGLWRSGPRRIAHVASCVGYVHPPSAKGPREGAEAERHPGRTPGHTNLEPLAEKNGRPRGTGDHRAGGRAPRRSPPPRPPVGCGGGHPGVRSFGTIDHGWLVKFVEHRIADRRILRLIEKGLSAGVLHEGIWTASKEGTPQGATVSPLLANIYLHYVFDLWIQQWRQRYARGDLIVVRYADDCAPRRRGEEANMAD